MIEIKDLHKKYGSLHVLKGITDTVNQGEVVVIIGPSGSGKSTFLRCVNKMEDPTEGHILIDGDDITDPNIDINVVRQRVGMVFQHFNLFPNMTILQNITLAPIQVKKMSQVEAEKIAFDLLAKVGLQDKAKEYPNRLSGGQKQRIAIARALAMNPEVVLFDEPTSAFRPRDGKRSFGSNQRLGKRRNDYDDCNSRNGVCKRGRNTNYIYGRWKHNGTRNTSPSF